jgi:hypothetical protein
MGLKKLQSHIHGWLPKEPALQTQQPPVDYRFTKFTRWVAVATVVGSIAAGLLVVVGSLLGLTEGAVRYAWDIDTVVIIVVSVGVFSSYMRRKLGLPEGTKPW